MDVLVDAYVVVLEDDVFDAEVRVFGRRLRFDFGDAGAGEGRHSEGLGTLLIEIDVELYAEKTARDFVVVDQRVGDAGRDIDRNREADSFVAAGGAGDGGVEAHHFAAQIHEWSAAIAGVDGGIGLDEILPLEIIVAEVEVMTAFSADDAARDALA